jgi:hypothetical protein
MLFAPNHVEIQKGEQIKFELYNSGELDHEFVLATAQENQKHAEAMKMNPEMKHHDPNATRVPPKKTDEIVWNFTKSGDFEFACLTPLAFEILREGNGHLRHRCGIQAGEPLFEGASPDDGQVVAQLSSTP